jgi:hypothetical protein
MALRVAVALSVGRLTTSVVHWAVLRAMTAVTSAARALHGEQVLAVAVLAEMGEAFLLQAPNRVVRVVWGLQAIFQAPWLITALAAAAAATRVEWVALVLAVLVATTRARQALRVLRTLARAAAAAWARAVVALKPVPQVAQAL